MKRDTPPPLLSDEEMARLHEEIFEEPISAEVIYTKLAALPGSQRACAEWVMDQRTWDRIRREHMPKPTFFFVTTPQDPAAPEYLVGRPVAIEPLAKLSLRCQHGHDHGAER